VILGRPRASLNFVFYTESTGGDCLSHTVLETNFIAGEPLYYSPAFWEVATWIWKQRLFRNDHTQEKRSVTINDLLRNYF
jgi:hypothetical protein